MGQGIGPFLGIRLPLCREFCVRHPIKKQLKAHKKKIKYLIFKVLNTAHTC